MWGFPYCDRDLTSLFAIFYMTIDQSVEDTAIDEGGPIKQFKTDCWKQLNNLSVPVGEGESVKLFEDGKNGMEGGIIPLTDELLEHRIKCMMGPDGEVETAKQRARHYMRAVGRIMFNSFQDFDAVPKNTMLPIFVNRESLSLLLHTHAVLRNIVSHFCV